MAATYSSLVGAAVGGKYEIRRVLGVGGMGVVCEGVHLDLGKRVAIKLIDKSMKETELIVERFRREARALGQIESEHIVTVSDFGADPRVGLYTVMELLEGEDLQCRLEREKRVDVKTAVMLAHQCARGLKKAHAAGVVHRDLKPANVFLGQRDNGQLLVKILDFGVSKILDGALNGTRPGAAARITGSGTPIGTPLYMSPEQAEGKDDIDGRADIWSLGAVLYEALAGNPPFADKGSYHGTIVGILTSRPALLHDVAPWVPAPLAKVIDAMLVHDPAGRIGSAEAVTKHLLDAFPAVLPDGTGRHTAIVVSHDASIDGTGDTDVFDDSVREELRRRRISKTTPSDPESPWDPSSAGRTGAATPVQVLDKDEFHSVSHVRSPKTMPLDQNVPSAHPSSSAAGVAMPGTPPEIDPLPASILVPDTIRDIELAKRGERRRVASLVLLLTAIIGVAAIGYFVGQWSSRNTTTTGAVTTAPPPSPSSAPAATTTAAVPTTAAAPPLPPATSVQTVASAAPAIKKPIRGVVKPRATEVPPPNESTPEAPAPSIERNAPF